MLSRMDASRASGARSVVLGMYETHLTNRGKEVRVDAATTGERESVVRTTSG
jgi:hypothetical protein